MRVDELQAFYKEHGTWRVPKNHPNKPLYTWTQNVRQRWRYIVVRPFAVNFYLKRAAKAGCLEFGQN